MTTEELRCVCTQRVIFSEVNNKGMVKNCFHNHVNSIENTHTTTSAQWNRNNVCSLLTVENDNLYYLDNFDVVTLFNTTIKLV